MRGMWGEGVDAGARGRDHRAVGSEQVVRERDGRVERAAAPRSRRRDPGHRHRRFHPRPGAGTRLALEPGEVAGAFQEPEPRLDFRE